MFNTLKKTIKTARTIEEINKAASDGYCRPLMKQVTPSKNIRSKYAICQNKKTGLIRTMGDYRDHCREDEELVIDFTTYYPYSFKSPFAAYLIPKDITVGEKVYIEDLIEDYVGLCWNQGGSFRLESCDAIWNGKDFDILHEEEKVSCVIG